jgi:ABC-type microcin C transport system duplicated ATPase subunit YejF
MRVGDQIAEAVLAHDKVSKKETRDRAVSAMNDVAIPDPALGRAAAPQRDFWLGSYARPRRMTMIFGRSAGHS